MHSSLFSFFFFFNDTATTEIYTLSLHDALPIWTVAEVVLTLLLIVQKGLPTNSTPLRGRGPGISTLAHLVLESLHFGEATNEAFFVGEISAHVGADEFFCKLFTSDAGAQTKDLAIVVLD